jgi:hypothetical protein
MKRFLRDNGLTLFFVLLFLGSVTGQAFAGHAAYNHDLIADQLQPISLWRYVTSSSFAADLSENWQSEYLQFWVYIMATVWLVQRGSPESKELGKAGTETDEDQQIGEHATEESPTWAQKSSGARLWILSNSLCLVMGTFFFLSWLVQSIAGKAAYNDQQLRQLEAPVNWLGYLHSADFWNRTLQNWQSEFLAVASMAAFSIYLRQRGSSQSKPVGAPHSATGQEN